MARPKPRPEEEQRELTRKEHRIRARDRDRNRKIMLGVGIALSLALLVVIIGLVTQFVMLPNSTIATVGGTQLITRNFWKRAFLEQNRMVNQLQRYTQLEQQFGGQGFFAQQISTLQGTLSSPFSLGVQVLDEMIREEVVRQKAAEMGITVSAEEVEAALREEVADQNGYVSPPQATATVEAVVKATATAQSWTPTPTATVDASGAVTATATPIPTPVPPPTSTIITDEQFTTGLQQFEENLQTIAQMSLDDYRKVIEVRLLDEKLSEAIGAEQVPATEEQVHARHILLNITNPITATNELTSTNGITTGVELSPTTGVSETAKVSDTAAASATANAPATPVPPVTEALTATQSQTQTTAVTTTESAAATPTASSAASSAVTTSAAITTGADLTVTNPLTSSAALTTTEAVTDSVPISRNDAETLALALEIRQRLENGEDFAALAKEYSDDTGSAVNGGDLGWFGRGKMVKAFEDAAFSLQPNEISQPIRSDFGYHIIQLLEKDANHPKDENTLTQDRATAYDTWIKEQVAATNVVREDLVSKLPSDLKPVVTQDTSAPSNPAPLLPDTSDAP